MKKVLIITYYWPPSGGAGVQRWLKFTKYLRDYGWEPVIYTPSNPEIPELDNSLLKDIPTGLTVLKQPIWEPYNIYKLFTFRKKQRINVGFLSETKTGHAMSLAEKISVWLRSNYFIPDARCFWIKPSVKFLSKYIAGHPVDTIVSTGPPHSMHIIALKLISNLKSQNLNLKWIADFRDPWTNIDFYKELKLSKRADKRHHKLELEVLKNADSVITIGKLCAEGFKTIYDREYEVITNGFDTDDVSDIKVDIDSKFSISHIGTMPKSRNPHILWKVLKEMITQNSFADDLEIKLVGKLDISVKESIKEYGLEKYVNKIEYLPHNEVVKVQKQSQILLLVINQTENAKGILTGKFFEYLAAKRPILCIGPTDGEIADIINETNSGKVIDFEDVKGLKELIANYYSLYKQQNLTCESGAINKYSRKELTKRLADILNR